MYTFSLSDNRLTHPGGCEIGPRPIDLHIKAFRSMGVKVTEAIHGFLYCEAEKLKGCDILLNYPSVGATENIMLASVFAEGETTIRNAAKEPEIKDLQDFLAAMGVDIKGAGTSIIRIKGNKKKLNRVEHKIIPDRIVAGTYLIAAAITGGELLLKNTIAEDLSSVIHNLRDSGCKICSTDSTIYIKGPTRPRAIDTIRTHPYPGFPTDMQAQMVTYLSVAAGTSIMVETVFENRYMYVEELNKMGANIKLEGRVALISGVPKLTGANINARDLRGGAALVLAGLSAVGTTVVNGVHHIDRGYESIETTLKKVGADIERIQS